MGGISVFGPENKYVVVYKDLMLFDFGIQEDEKTFLKYADDDQKRVVEMLKYKSHYNRDFYDLIFYQNPIHKSHNVVREGDSHRSVMCGDLEKILGFIQKIKDRLDSEIKGYDQAAEALKTSNKK